MTHAITPGCCCACVMGCGLCFGLAIILPFEIICAPVTIPVHVVRRNKLEQIITKWFVSLAQEDRALVQNELKMSLSTGAKESEYFYKQFTRYVAYLTTVKYDNLKSVKLSKVPQIFEKKLVWNRIPTDAQLTKNLSSFLQELKRQVNMSEKEVTAESNKIVQDRLMRYL